MCLIVFAWDVHPEHRLVLAANRDEYHRRPTRELHWWPDDPDVLAGRDLQAGGTWLAVGRQGRFAAVTNYREGQAHRPGLRSRGEIVAQFVRGAEPCAEFVAGLHGERYAGFSLLACDGSALWYASNRDDEDGALGPGVYGLSNASLDTPWPKLLRTRDALRAMTDADDISEPALMRLLSDRDTAPAATIERGALPFALAKALTAPFIVSPDYGTRCTSVLTWSRAGKIGLAERRFDAAGRSSGESRFSFALPAP